ncbi:fasciclin domain-containing protein [Leptolyngbya iicbica]|uniref:Fasciclin domain-containing protein n=2 Tax=Cyanophyceae TaxID=3028117 RepID=A0A4Q7EF22_9CYAN|nr:fasciclin domain-containing protein [Leptolyngbya sp. LK]RZM81803.1 fasciclin domain-containing protein [Leptolyngbya sp. LK]
MKNRFFSLKLIALASVCGLGMSTSGFAKSAIAAEPINVNTNHAATLAQATGDIVEVASDNPDFSTLVEAVQAAELVSTLQGPGPFTVFAPTNDAFDELPDGVLDALLMPENQDLLVDVLTYHVVPGEVMSGDLSTGGVETLNGGVAVAVSPEGVVVNNASVIQADVPASNGVIHAINRVLIPVGLVDELEARSAQPVPGLW